MTVPDASTFALTVPKKDNQGHLIQVEEVQQVFDDLGAFFCGLTIQPGVAGCWYDPERRKLQCEENVIVSSVAQYPPPGFPDASKSLCAAAHNRWERALQEAGGDPDLARDIAHREDEVFVKALASVIGERLGQHCIFQTTDSKTKADCPPGRWASEVPEEQREKDLLRRLL